MHVPDMTGTDYLPGFVAFGQIIVLLLRDVAQASGAGPVVETDKGKVQGFTSTVNGKTIDTFLGIPFAEPPLGELRFRPPIQKEPWTGILDATRLPNSCFQDYDFFFGNFSGSTMWNPNTLPSEDCLYLNVWVPRTKLPLMDKAVLVWVYGGGFYSGSSTLDIYQPSYLAVENDIIVVSMQYRVGALGFLALDTTEAPGNAGLWDQRMALEWVSRNIHNFGGSPHNVTLMGESAGAVSVGIFLLCDICMSYFHRAILQSGAPQAKWGVLPKEIIKKRSEQFAESVGCDRSKDHAYMVECLRAIPYTSATVHKELSKTSGVIQFAFVPIVDGILIRQSPAQLLRAGNFKKIPLLLGSNENEGTFFIVYTDVRFKNLTSWNMTSYGYELLMKDRMFSYYPYYPFHLNEFGQEAILFHYRNWINPDDEAGLRVSMDRAIGDCYFVCPVNELARIYSRQDMPVYYYWFSQRWSASPWPAWMGVLHADEIWFTFGHPLNSSYSFTKEERELSRRMMRYWTNFAKTG